jgi:formylmethanofuran dehydrogenase subunit C
MKGGRITVNGNTEGVGYLHGGEVHLFGDYVEISWLSDGGKIYHKGKLVFPKGDGDAG